MDQNTDDIIQQTLRDEYGNGKATIICVAHRLSTVLGADRILVMRDGMVAEFDTPANLLSRPSSLFSELVRAERAERSDSTPPLVSETKNVEEPSLV